MDRWVRSNCTRRALTSSSPEWKQQRRRWDGRWFLWRPIRTNRCVQSMARMSGNISGQNTSWDPWCRRFLSSSFDGRQERNAIHNGHSLWSTEMGEYPHDECCKEDCSGHGSHGRRILHLCSLLWLFQGFKIPSGTYVDGDIHQIMAHDPIFENPMEFRPERYLLSDGKTLNKEVVDRTIPFSMGRRQCAGEGNQWLEYGIHQSIIWRSCSSWIVSWSYCDPSTLPHICFLGRSNWFISYD